MNEGIDKTKKELEKKESHSCEDCVYFLAEEDEIEGYCQFADDTTSFNDEELAQYEEFIFNEIDRCPRFYRIPL